MKKFLWILAGAIAVLAVVYLLGPKPETPVYTLDLPDPGDVTTLERYIANLDSGHKIKPGNGAEIVWDDTASKKPTPYAIVYLHGFSASKEEGNPVHLNLARKLHANMLLTRLADHGIDTVAPMQYFTAERLWESGKQALAMGEKLGKNVILVGTSTGGTLALQLAAAFPDKIRAIILLSPNIEINDGSAFMVNDPWGLQIARQVIGGKERVLQGKTPLYEKYWYTHYRLESVVQLQQYLETTMNPETFAKVKQPTLLLYYFKDEKHQDPVVRVKAMLKMFDELGTPANSKFKFAIPGADNHVIGSYITSKDIPTVEKHIDDFAAKVLANSY